MKYEIPGFPDFQLIMHDEWRIWNKKRRRFIVNSIEGGYIRVYLSGTKIYLHRIIALVFHGPCPEGYDVRHLDDIPLNNSPYNLAYGTKQQNADDAMRNGRLKLGSENGNSKLTEDDVREIKRRRSLGQKVRILASEFGVTDGLVSSIANRKIWRHVSV